MRDLQIQFRLFDRAKSDSNIRTFLEVINNKYLPTKLKLKEQLENKNFKYKDVPKNERRKIEDLQEKVNIIKHLESIEMLRKVSEYFLVVKDNVKVKIILAKNIKNLELEKQKLVDSVGGTKNLEKIMKDVQENLNFIKQKRISEYTTHEYVDIERRYNYHYFLKPEDVFTKDGKLRPSVEYQYREDYGNNDLESIDTAQDFKKTVQSFEYHLSNHNFSHDLLGFLNKKLIAMHDIYVDDHLKNKLATTESKQAASQILEAITILKSKLRPLREDQFKGLNQIREFYSELEEVYKTDLKRK